MAAHALTTAFSCSQSLGGLPCAGPALVAPGRAPPRRSLLAERLTGGMPASPVLMCPCSPCRQRGKRRALIWGLESFAALADGTMIHNPRCYRKAEAYLRRCQRRVARRKKGSARRKQAVKLLAKAHLKVKRQRTDLHHKGALALVQSYDTIYYEDLQTANMVKNHSLAKSISDAAWSAFLTILVFKAAYAGKQVVAVLPAYTSQKCSGCGILVRKGLSVRWHSCPECGTSLHRDHNAALNILALGKKGSAAGQAVQALTQADAPYVA